LGGENMKIKWFGHSCFLIETNGTKILTDPFDESIGYPAKFPEVDLVTVSHEHSDHNTINNVKTYKQVLRGTVDKEINGIKIKGVPYFHDEARGAKRGRITIFKINSENLSLVHLSDLGTRLTENEVKELSDVNILLIPVGSVFTIGPEEAWEVVNQLKPNIVIPMHYKTKYLRSDLLGVNEFLKGKQYEEKDILDISKETLPEQTKIYVMRLSQ
jgi:L-ascorbate metabolism protein UlaG (beta-lactamase superfamily)